MTLIIYGHCVSPVTRLSRPNKPGKEPLSADLEPALVPEILQLSSRRTNFVTCKSHEWIDLSPVKVMNGLINFQGRHFCQNCFCLPSELKGKNLLPVGKRSLL